MATVLFYNFILLSSTFFVWLSEKMRYKLDRWLVLGVAFLLVFIPAAVRYDIGVDYSSYLRIYESGSYVNYQFKEPAFYFINWFLDSIGAHFQWLFAVFAFIFTAVAFKAYPRKNAWLLHFLFFSMLWFPSFNIIRQEISIAFCMLALLNYFDRRYLWFFILTVLASLFHQSALLITLTGVIALIPLPKFLKSKVAPLVILGLLAIALVSMSLLLVYIEQILNLMGLTKYANYFNNSRHFIPRDFGTGLGVLAKVLFSIFLIINVKRFISTNKNYWLLIILIALYALGTVLANQIIIFGRMADTFVVAQVLGAYLLWTLPSNKKINRLVVSIFMLFLIFSFTKDGFGIETSYTDPKRNPYQTIFSE